MKKVAFAFFQFFILTFALQACGTAHQNGSGTNSSIKCNKNGVEVTNVEHLITDKYRYFFINFRDNLGRWGSLIYPRKIENTKFEEVEKNLKININEIKSILKKQNGESEKNIISIYVFLSYAEFSDIESMDNQGECSISGL